ncbi:YciI family protein [Solirhodobacter olei]|uniref:YciI family protein n=1 Tax=Solirhodobacter olei TaxID=2493082 RepID=UPI000FDB6B45|nr:YciI family protein [Solirhodobacter olei]
MQKFVIIDYGDRKGYDRTPATLRDAAHAEDRTLLAGGAVIGIAGTPMQVRNPEAGGVETTSGPFMSAALPVAGFGIIEAASLGEAVGMVSTVPCAVAYGVVEVWPLERTL